MGVFFSIIIPVYNGEQYIKNCLDSIYASIIFSRYFFLSFPGDQGHRHWGLLCLS